MPETVKANPQAVEAIREADIIILGPGSLFTSILPNLLIKDISEQIRARDDIPKIYICNIMTQPGETDGFTAYDHVNTLINYGGNNIINSCLVNCGGLEPDLLLQYSRQGAFPVIPAISRIESKNVRAFEGDFVNTVNYIRHDTKETARVIVSVYSQFKKEWKRLHRK